MASYVLLLCMCGCVSINQIKKFIVYPSLSSRPSIMYCSDNCFKKRNILRVYVCQSNSARSGKSYLTFARFLCSVESRLVTDSAAEKQVEWITFLVFIFKGDKAHFSQFFLSLLFYASTYKKNKFSFFLGFFLSLFQLWFSWFGWWWQNGELQVVCVLKRERTSFKNLYSLSLFYQSAK